ncbi:hypothetical protein TNCV_1030601 [Trichonephila clavipes]|nr:hypothetical protein TNCV_1030601 [Trichonephila clavipes]
MSNPGLMNWEIDVVKGVVYHAQSIVECTCFEVDDATAEKLCDSAFVNEEAKICHYNLHGPSIFLNNVFVVSETTVGEDYGMLAKIDAQAWSSVKEKNRVS